MTVLLYQILLKLIPKLDVSIDDDKKRRSKEEEEEEKVLHQATLEIIDSMLAQMQNRKTNQTDWFENTSIFPII